MKAFVLLTAILVAVQALQLSEVEEQQWKEFTLTYNKQYQNKKEESRRKEIFVENMHKFAEHNKKYEAGFVSYTLGVNQFADLTREEFLNTLTPMNVSAITRGLPFVLPSNVKIPDSIDWRDKGVVTPVEDQGNCKSCYTFSATGALEGQLAIKTGKLISLSEQNLLDCSSTPQYGNLGCDGGWPSQCFQYIMDNGGIDTEESYPYDGIQGQCRYNPKNSGGTGSSFVSLPPGDENALLNAVGVIGPISIALNCEAWQWYKGGILHGDCEPKPLNHAVLVVGYGTNSDGKPYWIVKNSWGTGFGEGGYILLARNINQCGLASTPTYPLV